MLASGLLFLLWGAVSSVSAPWLYLVLWHILIYWSGERQATGGWHRVAMAAHLQHIHSLDDRFVTRCPSLCPCWKHPSAPAPISANPSYHYHFTLKSWPTSLPCRMFHVFTVIRVSCLSSPFSVAKASCGSSPFLCMVLLFMTRLVLAQIYFYIILLYIFFALVKQPFIHCIISRHLCIL